MKLKKTYKLLATILFCLSVFIIHRFELYSTVANKFYAFITFGLCIYNLLRSKNNMIKFILHLQLLYYNYSVLFSRYFFFIDQFRDFYINVSNKTLGIGIICILIFEFFIFMFDNKDCKTDDACLYNPRMNVFISILLIAAIIGCFIFAFDWSNFGTRGATSPIYEYSGILFVLGLFFSGKNKTIKTIYGILLLLMIVQGMIYGERVASLQFIFILFFYYFKDKISTKNVMIFSVLGIILMTAIGNYRSNYSLNLLNISEFYNSITERYFTFDGADLGYYCSLTFIMVSNVVSKTVRFDYFVSFVKSIFFGQNLSESLQFFTRTYYLHYYGGFYPLYFYFYGGLSLVIIFSLLWAKIVFRCLNNRFEKHKDYFSVLGLYLVCITARWYMYNPINAFRPVILFTVLFMILKQIDISKGKLSHEK